MPVNKTVLPNGIRILTHKIPHVRSVSMGVWVNVGARDEAPSESGLSHFIEHMIFKGTAKRDAFQIAKEFDAIGGHTNAFTAMETTCYHAKVMDSHINTMVDILSDTFLNSIFDPGEVERERLVISQEIEMLEDSPEEYIHVLSEGAFWGDNPLGQPISGSRENVLRFSSSDITDFFHRFYQPERIVISAAGNLEHDRLVDLLGPAFEVIKPGNGFPERSTPPGRSGVFLNERQLGQAHVCLNTRGFSITDSRRYTASLLNTLLGGNMSSRLFQEVRERRGLAYSVYSYVSSYEDTGMTGIYAGTHPDKAGEAVEVILHELKRLKETPVDGAELRDAKEYTKGSLMLASESVDNQMVRLAQNEIHFGCFKELEAIVEKIEAVTEEDIRELAGELFQPEPAALTLLGPLTDPGSFEDLVRTF
jgi:predicted Zn-dependent peptidase